MSTTRRTVLIGSFSHFVHIMSEIRKFDDFVARSDPHSNFDQIRGEMEEYEDAMENLKQCCKCHMTASELQEYDRFLASMDAGMAEDVVTAKMEPESGAAPKSK